MNLTDKTKLCISIAEKPGNFGRNFHNQGYAMLGLDFAYIPLKVKEDELYSTMQLVRDNFHACSVSMPHKINVINELDDLEFSSAKRTGAVNTILNQEGELKGFNTDYYGAKKAIESQIAIHGKKVLMLGAGGVARAIAYAVRDLGGDLTIINRNHRKAEDLARRVCASTIKPEELNDYSGHLLINATSIGMREDKMPFSNQTIENFNAVMDVVVYPSQTRLIQSANQKGKTTIPGYVMTTYQAEKQFEIYTGQKPPQELISQTLEKFQNQ